MYLKLVFLLLFSCLLTACKTTQAIESDVLFENSNSQRICEDLTLHKISQNFDRETAEKEIKNLEHLTPIHFDEAIANAKKRASELADSGNPLSSDLDTLEIAMIISYSKDTYFVLNDALKKRNCKPVAVASQFLASGVNKSPGVRGRLYRGAYVSEEDLKKIYKVHDVIKSPAFLSTSTNFNVAKRFMGNTLFSIENGNGGYIGGISRYASEDEVVLNPGTKLEVIKIEKRKIPTGYKPTEIIVIHLKQITETPHSHFNHVPSIIDPWQNAS